MSNATPDPGEHDLSDEDLIRARELVPIPCVDVLPWHRTERHALEVCLIERRDRPGQWNLIGGRIRRDEEISAALGRHLLATLGMKVSWSRSDFSHPEAVGQYFPTPTPGHGCDPRQHAVSFTYVLELGGDVHVGGEAATHGWFGLEEVPERNEIGYHQADVIQGLIPAVRHQAGRLEDPG